MTDPADEDLQWSNDLLGSLDLKAFHFETQRTYALGYERAAFEQFLAGTPVPPPDLDWWRPWLDEISRLTANGRTVGRVRVLDEPPTDYQRWEMWAADWHARAGEQIGYISRSRAEGIALPLAYDWWLLDDERVIAMWFTSAGEVSERQLITEPGSVGRFCAWRDLAVRNAISAEDIAAA